MNKLKKFLKIVSIKILSVLVSLLIAGVLVGIFVLCGSWLCDYIVYVLLLYFKLEIHNATNISALIIAFGSLIISIIYLMVYIIKDLIKIWKEL